MKGKPHISILPTRNVNCTFGGGVAVGRLSVTRENSIFLLKHLELFENIFERDIKLILP